MLENDSPGRTGEGAENKMRSKPLSVVVVLFVCALLSLGTLVFGCGGTDSTSSSGATVGSASTDEQVEPQAPAEVEATEFQGVELTPIKDQRNNALAGTKYIDKDTYTLVVDGLVAKPLSLSYADLQAYQQRSWLMDLNCVEGWSFTAKWTGPSLADILGDAQVDPSALIAIFYTEDVSSGYTSLDLDYILENEILLALKLNDVTLPPERGFPFQVVAKSKYGYKWAKWVTRIEISADADFRGYWESVGYSNDAQVGGPAFD
jgi:DMSO/TMAO reductase YedYZ molybdopterin-dependent catalytic subunit